MVSHWLYITFDRNSRSPLTVVMEESPDEIEDFYGVYLLYNINPAYRDRVYIGYTVDPNRRVRQHNSGKQAGGAWKTHGRGPWEMVLIVHGFPNNISALRFEWAWQHPTKSRRLKHLPAKKSFELMYSYRLRVLGEMLRVGPWKRLPLTIRWLKQEYQREFPPKLLPPTHMPIVYGPVQSRKISRSKTSTPADTEGLDVKLNTCSVCRELIVDNLAELKCLSCTARSHITCLAKHFLSKNLLEDTLSILPVDGNCPVCHQELLWGDLIRLKKGCYQGLTKSQDDDVDDDGDDWTNALSQAM
ncbi:structure-specific endonuclease subunit slx1 [Octopus vulgaris]|uniref:Structure-specific endonuclease subunit SLX1 homolog n=2 Tax=Octopus vulgaris TaxID=6645 RepID=A0AA36C2K0_OCTVU|nr:structure-specific endonuclease subunit slx1 [Octopus vulgaris]